MLIVGEDGKVQEVHAGFTEEVKNSLDTMIPQKLGLPGPKEAPQSAETDVVSKSKEKETKSSKKPSKKSRSKKGKGKAKGKKNAKSVKKAKD